MAIDEKELEKFDPTKAELTKIVEATKNLTATDLKDPAQLAIVREKRIEFKKARVNIEKIGKSLRDDANAFNKAVLAKEKELIGIISPEEDRLAAIEQEAKDLAIREERLLKLPARKDRLAAIKYNSPITDEALLDMDGVQFEAYFNAMTAHSLERERADAEAAAREAEEKRQEEARKEQEKRDAEDKKKREAQEKKEAELKAREDAVKEEERRIAHEKEVKEAEERARKEAEDRLKREAEEKAAKEKAEKEAAEKAEAEEKKKREKQEAYRAFRAEHGWTPETAGDFKEEVSETEVVLYKKVGVFAK